MLLLVKIAILVSLIKLLLETDKVAMCAVIYAGVAGLFTLLLGAGVMMAGITAVVGFLLAALYFWLLSKTQESALFWVVAVLGIVIGVV